MCESVGEGEIVKEQRACVCMCLCAARGMHCRDRAAWRRAVDTTGQGALQQDVSFVKSLFEALGTVYQVDEHQMDGA
jgi:hypothetical protein